MYINDTTDDKYYHYKWELFKIIAIILPIQYHEP